jgi:two-component system NtrC family sensor kinase
VLCGKLVSGLVHELNNPLDGLVNSIRLVKAGKLSPEREQEYLAMIESELFRMASLTKRMLGLARETPLQLVRCSLNDLTRKALFFVDYRMMANDIRLVEALAADLPEVEVDQTQILQVIVNLMLNAIESMPRGGTLSVETCASADAVRLSIADTGSGIAEADLPRIFDPFFTTKKSTGLGLAISSNIAEQHGGDITVDSVVGRGSIFTLQLPRS